MHRLSSTVLRCFHRPTPSDLLEIRLQFSRTSETLQGVGQMLLPGGRLSFLTLRVPPSRQIEPAADPSAANYKSSASDPARPLTGPSVRRWDARNWQWRFARLAIVGAKPWALAPGRTPALPFLPTPAGPRILIARTRRTAGTFSNKA